MAKINFMDRDNVLREFELKEAVISIGREATNKLVIADPSVSRQHAVIEKKEDGYYLVDKNSSNGCYVNGKRISQQKLNHKDKINLGSASVVFEDEEQISATFILPQEEMPLAADAGVMSSDEQPTDALAAAEVSPLEEAPLPPPPPLVSMPSTPQPPKPAAVTPPPAQPEPVAEAPGILCPSCRKVVESGARFCAYCGTSLGPSKPAPAPQPVAPPPPAAAKPSTPSPPEYKPAPPPMSSPKPVPQAPAAVPPPVPSFGVAAGGLNYAGFGVRLVAVLIDSVILSLVGGILCIPAMALILPPILRNEPPSPLAPIIVGGSVFLASIVGIFYQLYFIGTKGATPGKKLMKLRVTLPDGHYPVGMGKAFLRWIGYMVSGMICYIGFLMIAFDKEQHRGLHDKIAGTVVIKET